MVNTGGPAVGDQYRRTVDPQQKRLCNRAPPEGLILSELGRGRNVSVTS